MSTKNQDKQETIADIIAEKRKCIEEMSRNLSIVPIRREEQLAEIERIEVEASRLEDALKREATTTEKSSAVGNAAAMRDTLMKLDKWLYIGVDGNVHGLHDKTDEIERTIKDAIAAPPRNCDVGTAEEQAERYGRYCDKFTSDGMHCETCPCCGKIPFGRCEFAWSQMPYEEGEAK